MNTTNRIETLIYNGASGEVHTKFVVDDVNEAPVMRYEAHVKVGDRELTPCLFTTQKLARNYIKLSLQSYGVK